LQKYAGESYSGFHEFEFSKKGKASLREAAYFEGILLTDAAPALIFALCSSILKAHCLVAE
jgi:hypothetical protein